MTHVALHPSSDCTLHAIRSMAMALAIALNLFILLMASRPMPLTPWSPHPVSQALDALVLPTVPPRPVPPPPVLKPVPRAIRSPSSRPAPEPVPATAPVAPVSAPTSATQAVAVPAISTVASAFPPATSNATIAYETATPPAYPIAALRAGVQGTVVLRVLVDENGKPVQVLVAHSSGSHLLDRAALEHVLAAWRFHPATRDGKPVRAWAMVPVKFSLQNS